MPTYRLTIEYEGTRYRGWQEQQNARTVAGELRTAIEKVAGRIGDFGGAGRTDAGVHAVAQTAHLRIARAMDPRLLRDSVNDLLPPDIHLLSATPVHERFHARHTAISRSYLYQISQRRTAFAKRYVWWVKAPLDLRRMEQAARLIPGRHDFSLFCERPDDQTSTLVVVERAQVGVSGSLVLVRLVASHFLWRMVRRLVGTLVQVGNGRLEVDRFSELISGHAGPAEEEGPAQWTAPPSGLFLEKAAYPGETLPVNLSPAFPVAREEEIIPAPASRSPSSTHRERPRPLGPRGPARPVRRR
jgi:tRNA pseudouridine38-40 synthase